MAMFSDLSVRISAQTQDFTRGVSSAERSLTGLVDNAFQASGALQILQGRADEAGDEISKAGRSSIFTSGTFSSLSLSTEGAAFSMGTLSSSITTVLIPALAALSTTLVPIIATLGTLTAGAFALAGAFGAVIGSGLIAFGAERGKQNRERLAETRARIAELEALQETQGSLTDAQQDELSTLEDRADTLEDQTGIMGGLKSAFSEVAAEIRPMVVAFGQQFIPLIEDAIMALPTLVRNILDALGGLDRFRNALRQLGGEAMTAIPNMVAGMIDFARRALPMFMDAVSWIGENGPRIFREMVRTTERVGPALINITGAIVDAIPAINRMGIFILNNLLPAFREFSPQVAGVAAEVREMTPMLTAMAGQIISVAVPAFKALLNIVARVLDWFNSLEAWQQKGIITALAAAIGVLGGPITALGAAVVIAANHWDFFESVLDGVMDVIDSVHQALVDLWNFLTQNRVVEALASVGEMFSSADVSTQTFVEQARQTRGGTIQPGTQQQQTIRVNVEGDTDVVRNVTVEEINNRERRTNRNTGRNPSI